MDNYKIGDIVIGTVTGIENYGIFLSINDSDNVIGLIHISEISSSFVRNVGDYAELNEKLKAKIIDIDKENKKLRLSIKDFNYRNNYKKNSKIIETKSGFSSLERALEGWISKKSEKN